jgi:hypothetical protein
MSRPLAGQAVVVSQTAPVKGLEVGQIALFNADGTAKHIPNKGAAQADSTAEDATELVTDFNALLAKLRAANIIAT